MNILSYMHDHILLLDGGMGSLLQARGLQPGEHPERWNITHPDVIVAVQQAYFDAGTNVVNTNTFGANGLKFDETELEAIIAACQCPRRRGKEPRHAAQVRGAGYRPHGPASQALRRSGF